MVFSVSESFNPSTKMLLTCSPPVGSVDFKWANFKAQNLGLGLCFFAGGFVGSSCLPAVGYYWSSKLRKGMEPGPAEGQCQDPPPHQCLHQHFQVLPRGWKRRRHQIHNSTHWKICGQSTSGHGRILNIDNIPIQVDQVVYISSCYKHVMKLLLLAYTWNLIPTISWSQLKRSQSYYSFHVKMQWEIHNYKYTSGRRKKIFHPVGN